MKLTVSSTSMMKPIFCIESSQLGTAPPTRVLGLLNNSALAQRHSTTPKKLLQFQRPCLQHALLKTAVWSDFQHLLNKQDDSCVAVFGFVFDGVQIWYQLWNQKTEQACWLQHTDELEYEPYAILAMDALISLLRSWNGALHQTPNTNIVQPSTPKSTAVVVEADKIHSVLVSDASTNYTGQLWFLVTLNTAEELYQCNSKPTPLHSGWISTADTMTSAA